MSFESEAIAYFHSLRPSQYPFLERLDLARQIRESSCSDYSLTLVLRKRASPERLRLTFSGVRDLRIGDIEGMVGLIFNIQSILDRQLEDLSYQVLEEEQGAFSFYCADFEASLVDNEGQ